MQVTPGASHDRRCTASRYPSHRHPAPGIAIARPTVDLSQIIEPPDHINSGVYDSLSSDLPYPDFTKEELKEAAISLAGCVCVGIIVLDTAAADAPIEIRRDVIGTGTITKLGFPDSLQQIMQSALEQWCNNIFQAD